MFIAFDYVKVMEPTINMLKLKRIYGMGFLKGKNIAKNNHRRLSATKKWLDTDTEDSKQ